MYEDEFLEMQYEDRFASDEYDADFFENMCPDLEFEDFDDYL